MATDPSGLRTEIYVHRPKNLPDKNWYGHSAINVNGIVYTFGRYGDFPPKNNTLGAKSDYGVLYKVPESYYLSFPQFTSPNHLVLRWKIELSTSEERGIVSYFENKWKNYRSKTSVKMPDGKFLEGRVVEKYRLLQNNCTTMTIESLPDRIRKMIIMNSSDYSVPYDPEDLGMRLSFPGMSRNGIKDLPSITSSQAERVYFPSVAK
jgi:hypothetical protein